MTLKVSILESSIPCLSTGHRSSPVFATKLTCNHHYPFSIRPQGYNYSIRTVYVIRIPNMNHLTVHVTVSSIYFCVRICYYESRDRGHYETNRAGACESHALARLKTADCLWLWNSETFSSLIKFYPFSSTSDCKPVFVGIYWASNILPPACH